MIKFFRKIRQNLLLEGKTRKYLKYAIGEIVLVVVGILIALSINNWNEARKLKNQELKYLSGIKSDMKLTIIELENYTNLRKTSINSAENIIQMFNNKKEPTLDEFNFHNLNVQIWSPFKKNDNTYQELINSGNFAIISNDSIKDILLNIELVYKEIEFIESHMYKDFENYMFPIYFSAADLESDISNYTHQVSNGTQGDRTELSKEKIELLLKNQTFKNGFVLSKFNNNLVIGEYKKMKALSEKLLDIIDSKIAKSK
ncbi:DUF6090 family protein [Tamlana flava]|uniref:DUF6090 family protein n=1 Tax=Tamlana flava TaxID=3158572 RepID=UPI00351B141B